MRDFGRPELEQFFASAAGRLDRHAEPRLAVARPLGPRDQFAVHAVDFRRAERVSIGLADRGEGTTPLLQTTSSR